MSSCIREVDGHKRIVHSKRVSKNTACIHRHLLRIRTTYTHIYVYMNRLPLRIKGHSPCVHRHPHHLYIYILLEHVDSSTTLAVHSTTVGFIRRRFSYTHALVVYAMVAQKKKRKTEKRPKGQHIHGSYGGTCNRDRARREAT